MVFSYVLPFMSNLLDIKSNSFQVTTQVRCFFCVEIIPLVRMVHTGSACRDLERHGRNTAGECVSAALLSDVY